jgi:putative tricarboxylic transport membrane protein
MEILSNLAMGAEAALTPWNILYCMVGVTLGTLVGVLPGIGALAAVSMLLPVTYYLEPLAAIIMLAGVFYGAEYGGSTAAILLNLPGTPSSAVVCIEGYQMSRKGRAGVALFAATAASFIGGTIGICVLIFLSPFLVNVALNFGPQDYFGIMLFGLLAASTIGTGSRLRSIVMVVLGLGLGCVGMDLNTGEPRYTFGIPELYDGLNLVALAMGLYGVSEIISSAAAPADTRPRSRVTFRSMIPSRDEVRRSGGPILRGAASGSLFGTLPGTGATVASLFSYAMEKRVARGRKPFGTGIVEGVAAPESANNAAAQTAFIPTLSLGIPGSPTMALILGALMLHGIQPGPSLVTSQPTLFWGLIASFWIGNLLLVVLNLPMIGVWVRLLQIPYHMLYPAIIPLICVGVYSVRTSAFDVFLVLGFGAAGYLLKLLRFEAAPLMIGFVLGPMIEENLRRALRMSRGDPAVFLQSPISAISLGICAIMLALTVWSLIPRRTAGQTE